MNKYIKIFALVIMILFVAYSSVAQGWNKNRKSVYSTGIGYGQGIFIPVYNYPDHGPSSYGVSFNISGEYKAHRVLGLGWQTGINVFTRGYYYSKPDDDFYYYNKPALGIPVGFKMNVHILEAANAPIKNSFDVYAGFNVGGGPAFHGEPYSGVHGFFYVGPQVGFRYWFDNQLGIFGEFGWGASVVNLGISF
ncbi:MAG: hypothetical protein KBC43_11655 [Bacteroidales bacterium]|nr:hypothetical protein [Bacteroidales bacterium]